MTPPRSLESDVPVSARQPTPEPDAATAEVHGLTTPSDASPRISKELIEVYRNYPELWLNSLGYIPQTEADLRKLARINSCAIAAQTILKY